MEGNSGFTHATFLGGIAAEPLLALEPLPRFYLFSLKGYAYLSLRLGELDTGRAALAKLGELDPANRVGHRVLDDVLARMGRDDIGYEDCPDVAAAVGAPS